MLAQCLFLAALASRDGPACAPARLRRVRSCAGSATKISTKPFRRVRTTQVDTDKRRGFEGRACESCHGPGEKHAESADATLIRNPAKLAAAAADKICLDLPSESADTGGPLAKQPHARTRSPARLATRFMRTDRTDWWCASRRRSTSNARVATSTVWAQFQRPNHHKLPEGAMSCVDCHNPHGSMRPAMTQSFGANEPGCLNCHGDKRGPFTFEHGPVRFEGCQSCHEPHGSANPRMLTRQEVRFVCLECHANLPTVNTTGTIGVVPPAFHDLRSPRVPELHGLPSENPRKLRGQESAEMKTLLCHGDARAAVGSDSPHRRQQPAAGASSLQLRRKLLRRPPRRTS